MLCALTNTAAIELADGLAIGREHAGTLHHHANRELIGSYTGIAETGKYINQWNEEHPDLALSGGERDTDEDNASPYDGRMIGDDACNAMNCMRARLIKRDLWPESVTRFHKAWCKWKADNDLIDFTDMLELALENQMIAPGNPDVIFADEAQDFSALEMALLQQWGRKAGRLVVVGDPWQALYEWRGSDADVFFSGAAKDERVLGQSYRVPRAVHAAAMRWIEKMPGYAPIEYHPTEAEGEVASLNATYKQFDAGIELVEDAIGNGKSVMILATCAYMLHDIIKALRSAGIPFKNDYRRKNGGWNPLLRRGKSVSSTDRLLAFMHMADEGFWTRQDLMTWLSGASCSTILPGKQSFKKFEPILQNLNDGEIPYGLVETLLGDDTVEHGLSGALDWYVDTLNSTRREAATFPCRIVERRGTSALRDAPQVTVGTVHCSPGDEPILTTDGWVTMGELDASKHRIASHRQKDNGLTWGARSTHGTPGLSFEKSERYYSGDLLNFRTGSSLTRVTPNHKMVAAFAESFFEKWIVYLMKKGDWWRIGLCTSGHRPYMSGGLGGRLATEAADCGWILGVYETRESAIEAEAIFQGKYGIPGITFRSVSSERSLSTEAIERVHASVAVAVNERVQLLLTDFNFNAHCPLWTRSSPCGVGQHGTRMDGSVSKRNMRGWFETEAANLAPLSGYIDLPIAPDAFINGGRCKEGKWAPVPMSCTVSRQFFQGSVFGLDVEKWHRYISGGAVVHNSVKGGESDAVIIAPDLSVRGVETWSSGLEGRASIYRLMYVALTRAKESAHILNPVNAQTAVRLL
jgi:hypothetical protein